MGPVNIVTVVLAGMAFAVWAVAMIQALYRSRTMPVCWRCGAWKVTPSRGYERMDLLAACSLLAPVRCRGCLTRFYCVRGVSPGAVRPAWQLRNRGLRHVDHASSMIALLDAVFEEGQEVPLPSPEMAIRTPVIKRQLNTAPAVESPYVDTGKDLAALLDGLVKSDQPVPEHAVRTS